MITNNSELRGKRLSPLAVLNLKLIENLFSELVELKWVVQRE